MLDAERERRREKEIGKPGWSQIGKGFEGQVEEFCIYPVGHRKQLYSLATSHSFRRRQRHGLFLNTEVTR